jgi:hypothetical protein
LNWEARDAEQAEMVGLICLSASGVVRHMNIHLNNVHGKIPSFQHETPDLPFYFCLSSLMRNDEACEIKYFSLGKTSKKLKWNFKWSLRE